VFSKPIENEQLLLQGGKEFLSFDYGGREK